MAQPDAASQPEVAAAAHHAQMAAAVTPLAAPRTPSPCLRNASRRSPSASRVSPLPLPALTRADAIPLESRVSPPPASLPYPTPPSSPISPVPVVSGGAAPLDRPADAPQAGQAMPSALSLAELPGNEQTSRQALDAAVATLQPKAGPPAPSAGSNTDAEDPARSPPVGPPPSADVAPTTAVALAPVAPAAEATEAEPQEEAMAEAEDEEPAEGDAAVADPPGRRKRRRRPSSTPSPTSSESSTSTATRRRRMRKAKRDLRRLKEADKMAKARKRRR